MGKFLNKLSGSGKTNDAKLPVVSRAELTVGQRSPELLTGTVNLLLLRVLAVGPMHGYGIARRLKQVCGDVLQVGGSSLYPALQRLLANGWVKAEWGF